MELQFYPPGFTPFVTDSTSCSATKWCAALTIDSLECTFGFATCNNNCIEPVNFAYLQTNGVPAGPPSPQLADVSTFTPNRHTLMINPGDVLVVSISDPPQGFTTVVRDLTTHQTGFMTASAANGFMNTNIADCSGTPFTFHAEYSTAKQQNQVPWAALEGGVLMQQEIGHGEVCNSVTNQLPVQSNSPGGQSYSDPNVYDTCVGGSEGPNATGEGPCSPTTGLCQNATTQGPNGPVACPTNNAASGALCEFADGYCFPQGSADRVRQRRCRPRRYHADQRVLPGPVPRTVTWTSTASRTCRTGRTAAGTSRPRSSTSGRLPRWSYLPEGPVRDRRRPASEALCNTMTGAGCTAPPIGAKFYPFWSLSPLFGGHGRPLGRVRVELRQRPAQRPCADFGKDAQYGTPDVARYGGTLTSAVLPNPQFNGRCKG